MELLKIALTGGIACGKSQLADFLATLGAEIIRLDDVSKQVTTPNSEGLKALVNEFGEGLLERDGCLNREALRVLLLESETNKTLIEGILHPKILEKMRELQGKSKKEVVIVEIPLLFEKKLEYLFDKAIIVTCNNENQLNRLKYRANVDEKLAKKMISVQMSQKDRLKAGRKMQSEIIENNGSIADLRQQAEKVYTTLGRPQKSQCDLYLSRGH
ncbi:MAG: Dephospho-CoA kinase [Catillopecten margaritatus gill symbiont]|uniref:Dephospho-CoA kinase n=1 Tax=Catillopecten margaritatus gill symbiont TaxID=3083288 RepID=A0AAU6PHL7_9GAMM